MLNDEIYGRLTHLKNNMQHMWHNLQEKIHHTKDHDTEIKPIHIDNYHYESHRVDNVDLANENDEGQQVSYSDTENSEFSRGKPRSPAKGIDSFGEDDSIDSEMRH